MRNILRLLVHPGFSTKIKWLIIVLGGGFIFLAEQGQFPLVIKVLDSNSFGFSIGESRFTVYRVIKAVILTVVVFYFVSILADMGVAKIRQIKKIRASNRSLLIKAFHVGLYFVALMISLDVAGINIASLKIFSGAIGIGIGFGLQKIVSNFISGLILLFEKSVEEDDLVELNDGTYGFIQHTGARCTIVRTYDGREVMVPNEDFMTSRVTNWTLSNHQGRITIKLGVAYDSDLTRVKEIMIEAAKLHSECLADPAPLCFLQEFADSDIEFRLVFWINDVTKGCAGPKSDVMLDIWTRFKSEGIDIPVPRRDVQILAGDA